MKDLVELVYSLRTESNVLVDTRKANLSEKPPYAKFYADCHEMMQSIEIPTLISTNLYAGIENLHVLARGDLEQIKEGIEFISVKYGLPMRARSYGESRKLPDIKTETTSFERVRE
jgi:hypothetical protein